jgi:hypothetical protein
MLENLWTSGSLLDKRGLKNLCFFLNICLIYSWFQTFALLWMSYAFFWVIHRHLYFTYQHFGTHCLFHLHRWVGMKMEQTVCSEILAFKLQMLVNYPEESIWHVWFTLSRNENSQIKDINVLNIPRESWISLCGLEYYMVSRLNVCTITVFWDMIPFGLV